MNSNIYTIIPARGGSKSIPRKNIKPFNGYPLIKYSIDYSLSSRLVSKTVVSTDDKEIASISRDLGADVPFIRPDYLAGDSVQDYPVISHALEKLEEIYDEEIDIVILLRPTSPLRIPGLIESGIKLLSKYPEATSIRAVSESSEHPYRQWKSEGHFIHSIIDSIDESEPYNLPRQELPISFFQTGDIEIIRRDTILSGSVSGSKILPLIIDAHKVFDIDSEDDFKKAEEALEKNK